MTSTIDNNLNRCCLNLRMSDLSNIHFQQRFVTLLFSNGSTPIRHQTI